MVEPAGRPLTVVCTAASEAPEPALCAVVWEPSDGVLPYWMTQVVFCPPGLTVPFRTALLEVTAPGVPAVAVGGRSGIWWKNTSCCEPLGEIETRPSVQVSNPTFVVPVV